MKIALVLHKYGVPLDDPCSFPLGFMYVSAVLKEQGHTVKVLNYNLWEYDFVNEVAGCDVVMFTGFEEFKPYIIRDAEVCDDLGIKTVLGGALATFKPQEMLQHVDTVVVGEGEEVLTRALNAPGVIYGGRPDLDRLPLPDYEGFGIEEYHRRNGFKHIGVLTSRGCPHSCTFCAHTCHYQCRKLSAVMDEIAAYRQQYGIEHVVINDNTLNGSKGRFRAFCNEMGKSGLSWTAALRLDNLDESLVELAKSAGLVYTVVGVESMRQSDLDRYNKGISVEQVERGLALLEKHHIGYMGNLLVETINDLERNRPFLERYNLFPAPVMRFVGTAVDSAVDGGLVEICRQYIQSRGLAFNA